MTSRLELRHRYPEPPDRIREILTDPTYLQAKLHAIGGPHAELVSRDTNAQHTTIVLHQTVPAGALPSFVRSLLPGDVTIRRTETWTDTGGTVHSVVDGAPGTITGTMRLDPDAAGSVLSMQLEATVPVPLFGGKVEKSIINGISKLMDSEHAFTLQWLRNSAAT
jgi:hypothetical protein